MASQRHSGGRTQRERHRAGARHIEAAFRRAVLDRRGAAPPARPFDDLYSGAIAGRGGLRRRCRRGAAGRAGLRRPQGADHPVRNGHVSGRPHQCAGGRHLDRCQPDEPGAGRQCRGSRLHGRAGHHAQGAERLSARHRPVLSDRSGGGRLARRHGGDAGVGHQCGALRHDARQCHRNGRGDGERPQEITTAKRGAQEFGGLRPDAG